MNQWVILAGLVLAALVVAFIILRAIVYFVSSIPKWLYALVIFCAIVGAVFVFFGTTVTKAFGL